MDGGVADTLATVRARYDAKSSGDRVRLTKLATDERSPPAPDGFHQYSVPSLGFRPIPRYHTVHALYAWGSRHVYAADRRVFPCDPYMFHCTVSAPCAPCLLLVLFACNFACVLGGVHAPPCTYCAPCLLLVLFACNFACVFRRCSCSSVYLLCSLSAPCALCLYFRRYSCSSLYCKLLVLLVCSLLSHVLFACIPPPSH